MLLLDEKVPAVVRFVRGDMLRLAGLRSEDSNSVNLSPRIVVNPTAYEFAAISARVLAAPPGQGSHMSWWKGVPPLNLL